MIKYRTGFTCDADSYQGLILALFSCLTTQRFQHNTVSEGKGSQLGLRYARVGTGSGLVVWGEGVEAEPKIVKNSVSDDNRRNR